MRRSFALSLLLPWIGLVGCSDDDGAAPSVPAMQVTSPSVDGVANSKQPTIRWAAVDGADRYVVQVWSGDTTQSTPMFEAAVDAPTTEYRFATELVDGSDYRVGCRATDANGATLAAAALQRFVVRVPPDWVPAIAVDVPAPELAVGGYTLLNLIDIFNPAGTDKVPALMLVNAAGEIVWWYRFPLYPGFLMAPKLLPNGNLLFAALHSPPPAGAANVPGRVYETDWDGNVAWSSRDGFTPHHEVDRLPDGKLLILGWDWRDVTVPGQGTLTLEGDALEVVDPVTDQVVWRWEVFDHVDPLDWIVPELAIPGLSFRGQDWSHANAVEWDADRGVFWISFRHFDGIWGIDYPSGDIKYRLGKQQFSDPVTVMSHQHDPELQADGTLLYWDNGNGYTPPESRAVQLRFDLTAGTSAIEWEWHGDPAIYDFAVGDTDRLTNGNVLVTAGISRRVIEVVPATGSIAWELALVQDPVNARWAIYRSLHVDATQLPPSVLPFAVTAR